MYTRMLNLTSSLVELVIMFLTPGLFAASCARYLHRYVCMQQPCHPCDAQPGKYLNMVDSYTIRRLDHIISAVDLLI